MFVSVCRSRGDNDHWQLGDGSYSDRWLPTQVGQEAEWVPVSASSTQSLALAVDGSLYTWGYNHWGSGDAGTFLSAQPLLVLTEMRSPRMSRLRERAIR